MKHEIKNVVVINDFDYIQGGASKVAIETANLLKREYPQLNIYFFSGCTSNDNLLDNKIVNISTEQGENLKDKNKIRGMINGIYNFDAKNKLNKLLKTLNKDETIIHVHGWTKSLSCSIFDVIFKKKYKLVVTLHDYFTACPNGGYFNYKKNDVCQLKALSTKCIMCNCDSRNYMFKIYRIIRQFVQNKVVKLNDKLKNVIFISEFSKKILKNTLNKNINEYKLYNPIDYTIENKEIVNKKDYFVYVGRVSKEKGVENFCEVITETNTKGIVVGSGPELNKLKKIYNKIEFVGWKSTNDVKKYIKFAKALIFPSKWYETMGLTVVEALSLGTPVLVKNNTAAVEFVSNGKNGYVFNNKDELKTYMNKMSNFKFYNDSHNLRKFNENIYVRELYKIYDNIK